MLINFTSTDLIKLRSILGENHGSASLRETIILCIGDGIYHHLTIRDMFPDVTVLVLRDDYLLSGLPEKDMMTLVDYQDWVSLSVENTPVITI